MKTLLLELHAEKGVEAILEKVLKLALKTFGLQIVGERGLEAM